MKETGFLPCRFDCLHGLKGGNRIATDFAKILHESEIGVDPFGAQESQSQETDSGKGDADQGQYLVVIKHQNQVEAHHDDAEDGICDPSRQRLRKSVVEALTRCYFSGVTL